MTTVHNVEIVTARQCSSPSDQVDRLAQRRSGLAAMRDASINGYRRVHIPSIGDGVERVCRSAHCDPPATEESAKDPQFPSSSKSLGLSQRLGHWRDVVPLWDAWGARLSCLGVEGPLARRRLAGWHVHRLKDAKRASDSERDPGAQRWISGAAVHARLQAQWPDDIQVAAGAIMPLHKRGVVDVCSGLRSEDHRSLGCRSIPAALGIEQPIGRSWTAVCNDKCLRDAVSAQEGHSCAAWGFGAKFKAFGEAGG